MVEKEGADATFCGVGGGWTELKIFLPNWKTFCLFGRKRAPVFLSGNSKIYFKRAEDYVILCKSS